MSQPYEQQTEFGQCFFGDQNCGTLHTEDSSFLLPLQSDTPPSYLRETNTTASDLKSLCNDLSFQDIMEVTGFDADSNSLDSLIQSLRTDTADTEEFGFSTPSSAEDFPEAATPYSTPGCAYTQDVGSTMDSQQELYSHTPTTYSDVYNFNGDFSTSANLSIGNLTSNSSVQPANMLPLQWTGNADMKKLMLETPPHSFNGYSNPDVTVLIDPWATSDQYSTGNGHYDVHSPLHLGERNHMTSPGDSLPENPHRLPGQHRNCRVFLPEGEQKIKHIRQLANTRAKEHNARKKNERIAVAAKLQTEETRKQLLKQKYLKLLQEYRNGLSVKTEIQRDCSQCNFFPGQNNAAFSQ